MLYILHDLCCRSYGGPGSQKLQDTFSVGWSNYLASSLGIIVASIDGRGSSGRGNDIKHAVYRQLGVNEIEDQIVAAK